MIPDAFLEDLRQRTDLVELIGQYVSLRKAGSDFVGLCPFHNEKSPSFSVVPDKHFYHCFGCGAHGDAVGFLMAHAGLPFVEAVQALADRQGLSLPNDSAHGHQEGLQADKAVRAARRATQQALKHCQKTAADFYAAQLYRSKPAIDYLRGRRLSRAIAQRFNLGYAPAASSYLGAPLFQESDQARLIEAGLRGVNERGGYYERFRNRLMFPIRDQSGDVVGFGGRLIGPGEPKYLNSPETEVFNKGRELYGLYEAKSAIRRERCVVVVEGYVDVVSLAQAGIEHVVATLGTATTAQHIEKLLRFTRHIIFAFDGDAAGNKAAYRALQICLPYATDTTRFAFSFLPPEHDPDSFVQQFGADALREHLTNARLLSRVLIDAAAQTIPDWQSAEGKAQYLAAFKPLWALLPSGLFRQQFVSLVAEHLSLPSTDVEQYLATNSSTLAARQGATPLPGMNAPAGQHPSTFSSGFPAHESAVEASPNLSKRAFSSERSRTGRSAAHALQSTETHSFKNSSKTGPVLVSSLAIKLLQAVAHQPERCAQIDPNELNVFGLNPELAPIKDFIDAVLRKNIVESAQGLELAAQMFHSDKYASALGVPLLSMRSAEAECEFQDLCKAAMRAGLEAEQARLLQTLQKPGASLDSVLKQQLRDLGERLAKLKVIS